MVQRTNASGIDPVRLLARILCGLFGLIGALPFGAELLLGLDSVQSWAARETAQVLRDQIDVDARYSVRVHLLPLRLRIENLTVPSTDSAGPALSVERVSVSPRVFSLLAGRLDVGDVELQAPKLRLVIEAGKIKNVRYRLPESKTPTKKPTQSPFSSLSVTDARLSLDLDGTRIVTGPVDFDAFAERGLAYELMLSASGTSISRSRKPIAVGSAPNPAPAYDEDVLCRVELRARVDGRDLLVRRLSALGAADSDPRSGAPPACDGGEAETSRIALRLSQVRVSLREGALPYASGHVVLRAPLGLLNRFVRTLPLSGWVGFAGDVRYDARAKLPEVHGRVTGAGIALGGYRLARELGVELHSSGDVLQIPRFEMKFADGHVVAEGGRIEPFEASTPIRVARVEGKGILFESMMRDLDVTPDTIVRWSLVGTHVTNIQGTLSPLKLDADLAAETKDFEIFDRAYHDPARRHMIGVKNATLRGKFGVTSKALLFSDIRANFGKSALDVKLVSVGFENQFDLEVGSRLHLKDISPLIDIPMAGEAELSVKMQGVASDPLLTGQLKIAGFEFGGFPLGDIKSANVKFRPLWLELTDVIAKKGGSDLQLPYAKLDFDTQASLVVQARAQSKSLDLRDFFSMWHFDQDPRFDPVKGHSEVHANLRYVLGGPDDRCKGGVLRIAGKLRAHELDLFEERYDGGEANFDFLWNDRDAGYRGIALLVPDLTLQKGRGTISGKISVQPGAKVDGELTANGIPVGEIDALPRMLRAAEGNFDATGRLSGTLDALAADLNATISSLRIGRGTLPGSNLRVLLVPSQRKVQSIGTTRCGQPISAPFERAEYDRDASDGVFHLSGQLFGGQLAFADLGITRQRSKTVRGDVRLENLDLGALLELRPEIALDPARPSGRMSGQLRIEELKMGDPAATRGALAFDAMVLEHSGFRAELLEGAAPLKLGGRKLQIPGLALHLTTPRKQRTTIDLSGAIDRLGSQPQLDAKLSMRPTALAGMVGVLPRVERANGSLKGRFRLVGPLGSPKTSGGIEIEHGEIALRGLPTPLSDIDLAVSVDGNELKITRGTARFGGGSLALSGGAPLRGFSIGEARIRAVAREVALPLKDGLRSTADADLLVTWRPPEAGEPRLPRVTGNVLLGNFEYERPVTIAADLNALAQRGKRTEFEIYDPSEDMIEFDVTLKAERPLRIRNEIVEADLVLSDEGLELAGTNARFGLRGMLRLKPGGRVVLRRSEFEIREGSVRFDDLTRVAPRVDVTAVTEYRRYSDAQQTSTASGASTSSGAASASVAGGRWTIRMHAYGDADNLRVDLTSDPQLAQDDIFLLLTVGLTRAELDQAQSASVGESVALEALGTLTGADRAVKNAVPIIDEFRFGSAYSSRTGRTEPTVTVGKRLTERVRANVTSGLSESREVRSNVEWRLSPRVSVEGSYDNVNDISSSSLGNLGADVRWRLEFE